MLIKSFKIIKRSLLLIASLIILLVISSYAWLATGSKSLPFLAHYISNQVTKNFPEIKLTVTAAEAGINHDYLPYISLKNLNFQLPNSDHFQISSTKIKFNLLGIFPLTKFSLVNFEFSFANLDIDDFTDNTKILIPIEVIDDFLIHNRKKLKRFGFILTNTSFTIANNNKPIVIHIDKASVKPIPKGNQLLIKSVIIGRIGNEHFDASILLDSSSRKYLELSGIIKDFSYKTLNTLNLESTILKDTDIKFDINFNSFISKFASFDNIKFIISGRDGIIPHNQDFDKALKIESLFLSCNCQNNCNTVNIDDLKIISAKNQITGYGNLNEETLHLNLELNEINIHRLLEFWPKTLSQKTRSWLEKFLLEAEANNIKANLNLNLDKLRNEHPPTPDDIKIQIPILGAILRYPENSPPITDISGMLNIYGDRLTIGLSTAKILNSKLEGFNVTINDFHKEITPLNIKGTVVGPLQDTVDIAFIHAEKENPDLKKLAGDTKSSINIRIPLMNRDITFDEVDIKVNSTIDKFSANLFEKHYLSHGLLKAVLQNKVLTIVGSATYSNDFPIKIKHEEFLNSNQPLKYLSKTEVSTLTSKPVLKKIGYSIPDIIGGETIAANLLITKFQNSPTLTELAVDLKSNSLELSKLGIKKSIGEPGAATFKLEDLPSGGYKVKEYKISLPGFNSTGTIVLDNKFNILNAISNNTHFKNSTFAFVYRNVNQTENLLLRGRSIDLSNIDFSKVISDNSKQKGNAFILQTEVNQIKLKGDKILTKPTLKLKCDQYSCTSINITGNFIDGDNMEIQIAYPSVRMHSSNSGKFLTAFGISPNIRNGSLSLNATYSSRESMSGKLIMQDFYLKKAPLLAKLISLSALTTANGAVSLLQGKGILFEKLDCPFEYNSGVVKLNKCVQQGPTLTLQISGSLDLNNNYMNINGIVIFVNILDSIIDKIPIIGRPLLGGKNSGVLAANFSMKGDIDKDPSIFVNPLSILTPGFLRDIFQPKQN